MVFPNVKSSAARAAAAAAAIPRQEEDMRRFVSRMLLVLGLAVSSNVVHAEDRTAAGKAAGVAKVLEKCEHGVKKSICTRCNPKLEAVFKAKGDWCGEHGVPESQCAKCNPTLAKEGLK